MKIGREVKTMHKKLVRAHAVQEHMCLPCASKRTKLSLNTTSACSYLSSYRLVRYHLIAPVPCASCCSCPLHSQAAVQPATWLHAL